VDAGLHVFVRLLRLRGVRVSTGEVIDAMAAAAAAGLGDRSTLKYVLGATLVKDDRDWNVFSDLFDRYFSLLPLGFAPDDAAHDHGHGDLRDDVAPENVTISEEPSETPQEGHEHGKPADIRDFFDPADLATQYNLHQQADKIDLAAMTEELVLSKDQRGSGGESANRVQIDASRLRGAQQVKELASGWGTGVDTELTLREQESLLAWLEDGEDLPPDLADGLRQDVTGVIERLPELLKAHLERLAAQGRDYDGGDMAPPQLVGRVSEVERVEMEDALRRLARQMEGALTHRKVVAPRGRIDVSRTMRANLGNDGVPFQPVTVGRKEDRPRLVVLTDVSLSVRNSARFTLHLVHGMQRMFPRVRTFAFVDELVEVTDAFHEHPLEAALGLVFGGELLDVDANSNYGRALGRFVEDFLPAVTHRTTVIILGDGRGNGKDPNLAAFETITKAARRVVWLTPEPRYSWALGRCDLSLYEELCDRVEVVRDTNGLDRAAEATREAVTADRGRRRRAVPTG